METKPTYEQGRLQLELFDLRREARLRQARDWFFKNFHAETLDEAMKIAAPMTEGGTLFMMVISYWEQACSYLNHGLLHEDLFFESNGEFFGVWESVKATLPDARERWANKAFLANMEKAAARFEKWSEARSPGQIAAMRQWRKQMRAQMASAAAKA